MSAPEVRLVGVPDGPRKFVPELGIEVGTFIEKPAGAPSLMWHIPLDMRGDYRPQDLANYDSTKQYRTNAFGKVLCYAKIGQGEQQRRCSRKAVNRYPRCNVHGGRVHPFDKIITDEEVANNERQVEALSRYRQFLAGHITVDDLDDEELATCGFRAKNGRIYKPRNIPREMAQGFQKAVYERAHSELMTHTVDAAKTVAHIMNNSDDEKLRLEAAKVMLDRNLGKAPQVIAITEQKPFDEVFDDILTGRREDSRRARSIESARVEINSAIDVEVVEPSEMGTEGFRDATNVSAPVYDSTTQAGTGEFNRDHTNDGPNVAPDRFGSNESQQHVRANDAGSDPRLFERNTAILAPEIEMPEFEYDLSEKTYSIDDFE